MIEPTVRLPVAAHVIGSTPKAVSHWLADGLSLIAQRERRGRAFYAVAPIDLIRLSIVRRLIRYGFSAAEAEGILARSVDGLLIAYPLSGLPCIWPIVEAKLFGFDLAVSRSPEGHIRVSLQTVLGDNRGDAHGADKLTLDLSAIAVECRVRLESITTPALYAPPGGAGASKARLEQAGVVSFAARKPGRPANHSVKGR